MQLSNLEIERYKRHLLLPEVGGQGQKRLKSSHVAVIGAGGISSPLLLYIAAAGVGKITLIDDDYVDLSNLQRQVIHDTNHIDQHKVVSAAATINRINPHVTLELKTEKLDVHNAGELIEGADLICEGVDNFKARFILNKAAIEYKIPMISAAVSRYTCQLSVFHPTGAPGLNPCYRCFVNDSPPSSDQFDCSREGILGPVTGIIGTLAAMEAVKWLIDVGDPLVGRLLIYDALSAVSRTLKLRVDPNCLDCSQLPVA